MIDLDDYPLLHEPDFPLVLLRTAEDGPATIDHCVARIRDDLARAGVTLPYSDREVDAALRERLSAAFEQLEAALCVERRDGDNYRSTERGAEVLRNHPKGVDDSVLMEFPEFREYIRHRAGSATYRRTGNTAFDQGHAAFLAGCRHTENPYDLDSGKHVSWESGWFEAAQGQAGPARRKD